MKYVTYEGISIGDTVSYHGSLSQNHDGLFKVCSIEPGISGYADQMTFVLIEVGKKFGNTRSMSNVGRRSIERVEDGIPRK